MDQPWKSRLGAVNSLGQVGRKSLKHPGSIGRGELKRHELSSGTFRSWLKVSKRPSSSRCRRMLLSTNASLAKHPYSKLHPVELKTTSHSNGVRYVRSFAPLRTASHSGMPISNEHPEGLLVAKPGGGHQNSPVWGTIIPESRHTQETNINCRSRKTWRRKPKQTHKRETGMRETRHKPRIGPTKLV